MLDDLRFFDGILTADQIALIYNSGNGTESSLAELEAPPSSIGKVDGVSYASVGKVMGISKANVGKITGTA